MSAKQVVQEFQEVMASGDREKAFSYIAEDAVWHSDEIEAPWSGIHHGIEAIKKHFGNISGTTTDFKRHADHWIEHDDLLIEIGSLSCILNNSGKPFATEYICLYTVKNGKIHSYRIFEDSLKLYRAYYGK